jgi:hypothetical protein
MKNRNSYPKLLTASLEIIKKAKGGNGSINCFDGFVQGPLWSKRSMIAVGYAQPFSGCFQIPSNPNVSRLCQKTFECF